MSIVSMSGSTRRLKVVGLTPSASAACVRVYANRSTSVARRTRVTAELEDSRASGVCRFAFSTFRLCRRDIAYNRTQTLIVLHQ
jgi:hypothetical protein